MLLKFYRLLAILMCSINATIVQAAIIDFEDVDESASLSSPYTESGYNITLLDGRFNPLSTHPNVPDSGSIHLLVTAGSPASIMIDAVGGYEFTLVSFRIAEGRNTDISTNWWSTGVEVVANYSNGDSSITEIINMDQISANDPLNDFQFFTFSGFTGLSSVTITAIGNNGYSFSIDDIVLSDTPLSNVPVPAAVWLFASGLIGLIGFTRRKA